MSDPIVPPSLPQGVEALPMSETTEQIAKSDASVLLGGTVPGDSAEGAPRRVILPRDPLAIETLRNAVMLAVLNIDLERNGLTPDGNVRERLVAVLLATEPGADCRS